MPKTGSHLKIKAFGSATLGVELEGNPKKPEPDGFHIKFPGGEIYLARCTSGDYWVHVCRNDGDRADGTRMDGRPLGELVDHR